MTKLMQWLLLFFTFISIWYALVTKKIENAFVDDNEFLIQISPVIIIGLFGLYAVTTVLYRTFTFNDCKEAAEELQKQIEEAKKDLQSKGLRLS